MLPALGRIFAVECVQKEYKQKVEYGRSHELIVQDYAAYVLEAFRGELLVKPFVPEMAEWTREQADTAYFYLEYKKIDFK